jgi:proteasome lid subunit RPN8/RPN11
MRGTLPAMPGPDADDRAPRADALGAPPVRATGDEAAVAGDRVVPPIDAWQAAADLGAERRAAHLAPPPPFVPANARIPRTLLDELVDWARAGLPNEACGLMAAQRPAEEGGVPTRFIAMRNAAASPYRYLIDPDEQLRVMLAIDDADEVVWGICHSHVASPPAPSMTDIGLAAYPDALYLICSLAGPDPVVRAWSIQAGAVSEVVLEPI